MNMQTTLSATEARKKFFEIVDKVDQGQHYVLTVNGVPKAVMMDAEEYDSWLETLDIMSRPKTVKAIEEGKKDLVEGRYSTFEEVFNMTPSKALAIADQKEKRYDAKRKK